MLLGMAAKLFLYALQAAWAQELYFRAKYGGARGDVRKIVALCQQAQAVYPHHYFFSLLAAEAAWAEHVRSGQEEREQLQGEAWRWCHEGLRQNRYWTGLRALRVRLLAQRSAARAARDWDAYVDWHFWEPAHHAWRVKLYAAAGQWEKAFEALRWVRGTPYEQEAVDALKEAWQRERQPLR